MLLDSRPGRCRRTASARPRGPLSPPPASREVAAFAHPEFAGGPFSLRRPRWSVPIQIESEKVIIGICSELNPFAAEVQIIIVLPVLQIHAGSAPASLVIVRF